jgi:pyruvate formate lyase activating enzyme
VNKGLIFDIRRFGVHDGPGIRTTIFFKGCPMNCWWCHNPESQCIQPEETSRSVILDNRTFHKKEITGTWMTVSEVMNEIRKDRIFYDESYGGVTLSGGEPLLQMTFLEMILDGLKKDGIHATLDTSGFVSRHEFLKILHKPDLFLYDIKILDEEDHQKYTGVSNTGILDNLLLLCSNRKQVILRFPVVPGITDTRKNLDGLMGLLRKIKDRILEIDLLPYHSMASGKYKKLTLTNRLEVMKDVNKEELNGLRMELEGLGCKVKIGG